MESGNVGEESTTEKDFNQDVILVFYRQLLGY